MLSLKLIIRQLLRNRNISFFKLISLVVGFTISLLIFQYVGFQYNFDDFHEDGDRMYRIGCLWDIKGDKDDGYIISAPTAEAFHKHIPEIENYALVRNANRKIFTKGANRFDEKTLYADTTFFNFFSFPILKKAVDKELRTPYTAMISEDAAKRIFGEKEAIGEMIFDTNNKGYEIQGVFKNIPGNSHLDFDLVLSFETIRKEGKMYTGWDGGDSFSGYVKTISDCDIENVQSKLQGVINQYTDPENDAKSGISVKYYFQELEKLNVTHDIYKKLLVFILAAIGIILLVISILNYVLLSVSSFQNQISRLSVQQCFGAGKRNIRAMILTEHISFISLALVLSFFLIIPTIRFINHYLEWDINFNYSIQFLFFSLFAAVLSFLLSAGIPLLKMYRLKYQLTLYKAKSKTENRGKQVLLTIQMLGVISMLIMLLFVIKQLNFVQNLDLGYKTKGLAYVSLNGDEAKKSAPRLMNELSHLSYIENVSASSQIPLTYPGGYSFTTPDQKEKFFLSRAIFCTPSFIQTHGMKIKEGNDLSDLAINDFKGVLINQRLANMMNWENPVGKILISADYGNCEVIGVVDEFVLKSAKVAQQPFIFYKLPSQNISSLANYITISFRDNMSSNRIDELRILLTGFSTHIPLELNFFENQIAYAYKLERQINKAILLFSLIAILLTVIGLVGYISHETNLRTKEIGIRKVNGAGSFQIMKLLNVNFIKWVSIAFIIACPILWFAVDLWLQYFAYKTELSWWVFAIAGLIAMTIALLTVSIQSWRAATRNPIESLRYE